jgi:sigma-B regulation protein RsbU (phosphoserine phosphatase)
MEDQKIVRLKKELKLKRFQFNSIYEFSSSLYSSFDISNIIRILFSTLMGQMAISRIFFFDTSKKLFRERGCKLSSSEIDRFRKDVKKIKGSWFSLEVKNLSPDLHSLQNLLLEKKVHYLVNISDSSKKKTFIGLGYKFNKLQLSEEEIEFSFFISRFALIAIDNAVLLHQIIENKRIEHEIKIAKDIQLSLLPQRIPKLSNFEISVVYRPINEVGGDYYDILKERQGMIPVLIADVEGKGLPAALLAASSQAIFHSLNELYFFKPAKFISKANSLIYNFTKGNRFITLFWLLVDDENRAITYVNAGHIEPFIVSGDQTISLSVGGFLTGFVEDAEYEMATQQLKKGDILVAYTDGVIEVNNPRDQEYGRDSLINLVKANTSLSAEKLTKKICRETEKFSKGKKYNDDFTLIVLKAKSD